MEHIWALHQYNLNDDGFGNLVIVPASAWASAHYFAYGAIYNGSKE